MKLAIIVVISCLVACVQISNAKPHSLSTPEPSTSTTTTTSERPTAEPPTPEPPTPEPSTPEPPTAEPLITETPTNEPQTAAAMLHHSEVETGLFGHLLHLLVHPFHKD